MNESNFVLDSTPVNFTFRYKCIVISIVETTLHRTGPNMFKCGSIAITVDSFHCGGILFTAMECTKIIAGCMFVVGDANCRSSIPLTSHAHHESISINLVS